MRTAVGLNIRHLTTDERLLNVEAQPERMALRYGTHDSRRRSIHFDLDQRIPDCCATANKQQKPTLHFAKPFGNPNGSSFLSYINRTGMRGCCPDAPFAPSPLWPLRPDSISKQLSHAQVEFGEQCLGEGIPVGKNAVQGQT